MGNQPWPQFQNGIRERSIAHTFSHYSTVSMSDLEFDLESDHVVKINRFQILSTCDFDENGFKSRHIDYLYFRGFTSDDNLSRSVLSEQGRSVGVNKATTVIKNKVKYKIILILKSLNISSYLSI